MRGICHDFLHRHEQWPLQKPSGKAEKGMQQIAPYLLERIADPRNLYTSLGSRCSSWWNSPRTQWAQVQLTMSRHDAWEPGKGAQQSDPEWHLPSRGPVRNETYLQGAWPWVQDTLSLLNIEDRIVQRAITTDHPATAGPCI